MQLILSVIIALLLYAPCAFAEDFYVTNAGAGTKDGLTLGNAWSPTEFNTAGNWGAGAGKVSAGDTVHISGTITGTNGQNILTTQGSGTSGAGVITIKFEDNAILQAGYVGQNDGTNPSGGAISIPGHDYFVIDGGTNGIIQNTANGTLLANQQISAGLFIGAGSNNIEVKNLTIRNIYVPKTDCTDGLHGGNSGPIVMLGDTITNISIHDNTLSYGWFNVFISYDHSVGTISIYNNTMQHCGNGCIIAGDRGDGAGIDGLNIYNNDIGGNYYYFYDAANNNHLNAIFLFAAANSSIVNFNVYNNYVHGNFGTTICGANHTTAHLQVDCYNGAGGVGRVCSGSVYNNLMLVDAGSGDWLANGFISMSGAGTRKIYNNTMVGQGLGPGMSFGYSGTTDYKNNILVNVQTAGYGKDAATLTANYNLYYQILSADSKFQWGENGNENKTWAQWQALGFDANSVWESDPLFASSSVFTLQSGSPAKWTGTATGQLSATDKLGINWHAPPSIGAYEYEEAEADPTGTITIGSGGTITFGAGGTITLQ